jgi:tetratricopeptide (TPR) repeat protein
MKKIRTLLFLITLILPSFLHAGDTAIADYKIGLSLYSGGHYESALNHFLQAVDENFDFWQSYQMVGYCYFEMREKEEALKAFEESLKLNPNNPKLVKIYNDLKAGSLDIPLRPAADTWVMVSGI